MWSLSNLCDSLITSNTTIRIEVVSQPFLSTNSWEANSAIHIERREEAGILEIYLYWFACYGVYYPSSRTLTKFLDRGQAGVQAERKVLIDTPALLGAFPVRTFLFGRGHYCGDDEEEICSQ